MSVLRSLARTPKWAALVVLTLAVGIGAATAVFGVVDAVLIKPLPYANAERLREVRTQTLEGRRIPSMGGTSFRALQRDAQDFAAIEGYQFGAATLTGDGEPVLISAPRVTPGLLQTIGVRPVIGRLPANEDTLGAQRVALISERLWTSRFARSTNVIGRSIALDDESHIIVGVLPSKGAFPEQRADVWRVIVPDASGAIVGRVQAIAALRGVMPAALLDERLRAVSSRLHQQDALARDQHLYSDELIQQRWGRPYGAALYTMLGAVALVLLVACVNVTNLLLMRAVSRQGEFALMDALGAGRSRIVSLVLVEALVLAFLGGAGAIAVAQLLLTVLLELLPPDMTLMATNSSLNWRALSVAVLLSTTSCVAVVALPALRSSRIGAIDRLRTRTLGSQDRRDDTWQSVLVAGQLALVLMLLTGTGLLLRGFVRLINVDPGFEYENLLVFEVQPPDARYAEPGRGLALFQQLDQIVERQFGSATFAIGAPPRAGGISNGHPEAEDGVRFDSRDLELPHNVVAPDYFAVLGIPLVEGRAFRSDDPDAVVIVNDVLARRFWGGQSPLGRRFRLDAREPWLTVVGVARDVKVMGFADPDADRMEIYLPYQREAPFSAFFTFIVRASGDDVAIARDIKAQLWKLDPKLPIVDVSSMDRRLMASAAHPRFLVGLASAFAAVAVLLAGIGVYGTAAYWVARRRRDLGIRMALGASRHAVLKLVLARGMHLAMWGGAAGMLASLAATRILGASLLFETSPRDPSVLCAAAAALVGVALVACCLPAIHAARVDPANVLRIE